MSKDLKSITGIILAGGKSSRMGFNKAFLDMNGKPVIHRTISLFQELFDETLIVANNITEYEKFNIPIVTDIYKGAGSMGGIYTGLFHTSTEYSFVAACDMPFLSKEAVTAIVEKSAGFLAAVPFISDRYHPLHAAYSKRCLPHLKEMIQQNDLRIANLFQKMKIKKLSEKDFPGIDIALSLDNINTREDLHRAAQSSSLEIPKI